MPLFYQKNRQKGDFVGPWAAMLEAGLYFKNFYKLTKR